MTTTDDWQPVIDWPPRDVTDSEPAPAPHTVGWDDLQSDPQDESTRTRARVHARVPDDHAGGGVVHTLFVGDRPWPWQELFPRLDARVDYALNGDWCSADARAVRWLYLLFFVIPIACPIAAVIDLVEWLTFPLGRLALTAVTVWLFISAH